MPRAFRASLMIMPGFLPYQQKRCKLLVAASCSDFLPQQKNNQCVSNLRELREQKRWKLRHLAEASGQPVAVVSRDERDDTRLTLPKMRSYARALGCLIAEIAGELPVLSEEERSAVRFLMARSIATQPLDEAARSIGLQDQPAKPILPNQQKKS